VSANQTSATGAYPLFEADGDEAPATAGDGQAWTERDLLDRLRARHSQIKGNGPEWAYMEHVRDAAGFDAGTTIDALALHLWPSRNHVAHAYEVKVSRADFRRELANEQVKSLPWRSWVDYFWIVAPVGVVPLDELPAGWGLLVTHGRVLTTARRATRLRPKPAGYLPASDLPRGLVVAMLRAQVRNAAKVNGYWQAAPAGDAPTPDANCDSAVSHD
jgi:hypothetical protein